VGIGLFTQSKRTYMSPAVSRIEVPLIEKKTAQVIAVGPDTVQLMDLQSFQVFEVELPKEPELRASLQAGAEVEYWSVMGRKVLVRVK
jgi:translation initiation factor 5A